MPLSKDEITRRIKAVEAELADLRRDIINGPQSSRSPELTGRRNELMAEIAVLKAALDKP